MAFLRRKKALIGLDIGSHSAKILQLKQTRNEFIVQKVGMAQYPSGSFDGHHIADIKAVAKTISKLWQNLNLEGKKVVLSVPGNEIMTEMPRIPLMKRSAVFSYVDDKIKDFITYSPDEVFYGVDILEENKEGTLTILIAYARRGIVYDYEKLMSIAGLYPVILDVDYFALFNAFEATEGLPADEVIALVDIGASKSISVIIENKFPAFTKSFLMGTNELIFQLMDKFTLSYQDAYGFITGTVDPDVIAYPEDEVRALLLFFIDQMVSEMKNIMDYFSSLEGKKVKRVFLSGGLARSPGIALQIEKSLGIPVFIFNPLASEKVKVESDVDPDYVRAIGPQMAICFGLALRQEEGKGK
ncbi:MAG: type IV pilus assembly protein PilM [Thermodesulforhabdaceae bacterium]